MRIHCLVILSFILTKNVFASDGDTSIVRYNEAFVLKQFSNDRMIMVYRDVNDNKQLNYGYDIYFEKGKVDSMICQLDSISFKMLYRRAQDNKWEMAFSRSDGYRYPNELTRNAGLVHGGILGLNHYKMTLRYDLRAEAIRSIEQRINDFTDKAEGIIITFKNGNVRYVNFLSSSGLAGPTMFFKRSGRIKKMYVRDYVDTKTGLSMYLRLKYYFGRLK